MSNTYSLNNYTAVVSLNERTIYFKLTDTINFISYESNVNTKELRTNLELGDCFTLICKCFAQGSKDCVAQGSKDCLAQCDENFKYAITTNNGTLKIAFNAIVGGFLKVGFDVILLEKIMSNDGQLTLNFNRLEQKLVAGLEKAMAKCAELETSLNAKTQKLLELSDRLGYAHICMTHSSHPQPHHFIPIGVREITNFQGSQDSNSFKFEYVQHFYRLEKLVLNYCRIASFTAGQFKNNSLKTLEIQCHGEGHLTSIGGIKDMPALESLTIRGAPGLSNVVSVLNSYNHNIKSLTFQGCPNVNVVEMQTYCQKNNIKLDIA